MLIIAVNLWVIVALKSFELIWARPVGDRGTLPIFHLHVWYGLRREYAVFRMGWCTAIAVVLLFLVMVGSAVIEGWPTRSSGFQDQGDKCGGELQSDIKG